ncbi:MAG: cytochrome C oxidase subunit IV family protein [Phycisphaerae bacterium]|nr:cytochrome C oxidase subunit IV family protein [Phycisphaerae bacterium]
MAHSTHASKPSEAGAHAHPAVGHLVPVGTLMAAGLALLVLTVITVAVRYVDVGEFNLPIALGVAVVKAAVVVLIFMHLRWDRPFNSLVLVGSIAFVVLMMVFTMMDVGQLMPTMFKGNAPEAQLKLNELAPGAPITRDVESTP